MLLVNRTPLHVAVVPNADNEDGIVSLLVVAITLDLTSDRLRCTEEQRPLQLIPEPPEIGDHYLTKAGVSVTATGFVYAPGGWSRAAEARLIVGDKVFYLAAFGKRTWQQDPAGVLTASAAAHFDKIAMTWENAYGGGVIAPTRLMKMPGGDEGILPEHPELFPDNMDGIGFYTEAMGAIGEPLPHLENPEHLIQKWDDRPDPVCFAPYPMHGGLRRRFVMPNGTLDVSRHPHLLSRAAPQTTFDEVPPGTRIGVTGMRPGGGVLSFEVPPPPVIADVTVGTRHRRLSLYVDAVDIDAEAGVARVVYRALYSYPLIRYEVRSLYVQPSSDFEKLLP
ncbi:MAG: DUF2169 domain-containing protein [Polyangiaceae bacterium]|nr:DUF2169 domain-containing protein [Polyangiaceae bacterium]